MNTTEVAQIVAAVKASPGIDINTIVGWIAAISAAVTGAIIGGRYVKQGVLLAAENARKAERDKERVEIENLRKALLVEIEVLVSSYQENAGVALEAANDNQPFPFIYPTHQRYFVIFEENAHLIGRIPDDLERELIVKGYAQAKGLLDSYRLNNTMTEKHNFAVGLGPAVLGQNANFVVREIHKVMSEYTPVLKKLHYDAIETYDALVKSLSKSVEWD